MTMKRTLRLCGGLLLVASLSGCTICPGPYDDTYSAYGGRWKRLDPVNNRVGSAFVDAGTRVTDNAQNGATAAERDIYPELSTVPTPAR